MILNPLFESAAVTPFVSLTPACPSQESDVNLTTKGIDFARREKYDLKFVPKTRHVK